MSLPRVARLRARVLLLVGLAVIPALGTILYTGLQERRDAASRARREALALAAAAGAEQQRLVAEARQLLAMLARLPQIRDPRSRECSELLAQLLTRDTPYANLGVILPDGRLACSARPFEAGLSLADRTYFREAVRTRDFAVGDYQIGRVTGQATVNFAYPLLGEGRRVEAVVYAALSLDWLSRRVAVAELPPGSAVSVISPSLTVLARVPDGARWVGRSIRGTELAAALGRNTGEEVVEAAGLDGVRRLFAIVALQHQPSGEPVHLAVGIPAHVAYAEANQGMARNLAMLLLLTALVLAAAWWGSEMFVLRPVRALLSATRRLAAGDLSARAPRSERPGSRAELDELADAFNEMAGSLERREGEITEHLSRIDRLNRVYAVLSGINSALLRVRDREELLRAACRTAVDHGRFRLAIVHRLEGGIPSLEVAARADGGAGSHTDGVALATAVCRDGRPVVVNDLGSARARLLGVAPLRDEGYGSAAGLPLRTDRRVVGVLSLYAAEPDFFDEEEVRLLRELAADTALGLEFAEKERQLHFYANFDTLTDLPNLALFQDRLRQAIERARNEGRHVGVLMVSLDPLPQIVAALGHAAGDRVLQAVARYLTSAVRPGDTVARVGSNDFGVVVADVEELSEVETIAAELAERAPSSLSMDDQDVFFALHIGGTVFPDDGEEEVELIRNASLAREEARPSLGAPVSFFSSEINQRVQRRRDIERELRHAVERGELRLLYQPVVDVRRRLVVGVEALLRWQSERLGALSPVEFIPVAEETGLITSLGEWIVAEACRQGRAWAERGLRQIRINVNVSVDQLRQVDFVARISRILEETGFEATPLSLGIEITESELMENVEEAVAAISHFQNLGMTIYIDDFGTGYSSLSYLRQLPIDTLKIDASFVRDMPGDADAVAVVSGIIAMAHGLELRVVAEGVETPEQFATLTELGCDSVQGYLFSRPVPPEEIEALLARTF